MGDHFDELKDSKAVTEEAKQRLGELLEYSKILRKYIFI